MSDAHRGADPGGSAAARVGAADGRRADSGGDEVLPASRWARSEMAPVGREGRTLGTWGFAALWITMAAQLGVFTLGASLVETMSTAEALAAVLIGNLAMLVILVLIGDIGIEHGINFASYLRAPFGMRGSYLPLALRGLAGVAWVGIQTYLAATAIDEVTMRIFDLSAVPVWYVVFGVVQILVVAAGLEAIKKAVNIAAPALVVLSVVLIVVMVADAGSLADVFDNTVPEPAATPLVVGAVANLSYWSTVAVNLPDFTRNVVYPAGNGFFRRNRASVLGQLLGVPTGMLLFTGVGMVGFVLTGESNPVLAIAATIGGALLMLALGVVILAQISTNITANLIASTYAANAIGAPRVSYRAGAVITGLMGIGLTFPWLLLDLFLVYLPSLGALLSPVAAIMIADYYVVRRRRLLVRHLYEPNGQYRYWRGVNPVALVAWVVGAAGGIAWLDYSVLVAMPLAFVLYLVGMEWGVRRRWRQEEIDEGGDEHLAASVGRDWPIRIEGGG